MNSEKNLVVDEVSSSLIYIGEAAISVSELEPFWKIKRIKTIDNIVRITWADGNENYDNVWASRTGYLYS